MKDLSYHFSSNGLVLYDSNYIGDDDESNLKEELYKLGKRMFHRESGNRVRGGLSMNGDEVLVSETNVVPIPGVSWTGTPVERIARDITDKLISLSVIPPGTCLNYCLYNMYETNNDYIAFHSDSERNSVPIIASLSLGAPRKFVFLEKQTNDTIEMSLVSGSLLVFGGQINTDYMHSVPPCKKTDFTDSFRINLTFRVVNPVSSIEKRIVQAKTPFAIHKEIVNGFTRRYFTEDFWFITPAEALTHEHGVIMLKKWGTAGKLSIQREVIVDRVSNMRCKRDDIFGSTDWFILPNKVPYHALYGRLVRVSKFLLWKYTQVPNKRPVPIKVQQLSGLYYETPEPGRPRKHFIIES